MKTDKLTDLTTAIISANPEIETDTRGFDLEHMARGGTPRTIGEVTVRNIGLEDVMVAIGKNRGIVIGTSGNFYLWQEDLIEKGKEKCTWIPNKPLQDQSPQLIEFLHKIICQK